MTRDAERKFRGRVVAGAAAAIALAGVLSGVGLTSATASPAAAAWSGTEHFTLMSTKQTADRSAVIMTGLFTLGGLDIAGNSTDTIRLPGGSFKIYHGSRPQVLTNQFSSSTCLGRFKARVKFSIGGGAIKWKGITGSGTATITDLSIGRRTNGACNPDARPLVSEQTITATASVKLAS
jgi:hypothetical protein